MICACFIGLLAWSLHANGGTGNLVAPALVITRTQKAFRMVQCISSVGGSWGKSFLQSVLVHFQG
jgi:NCS1 family nucleobase:cation symporter-1